MRNPLQQKALNEEPCCLLALDPPQQKALNEEPCCLLALDPPQQKAGREISGARVPDNNS